VDGTHPEAIRQLAQFPSGVSVLNVFHHLENASREFSQPLARFAFWLLGVSRQSYVANTAAVVAAWGSRSAAFGWYLFRTLERPWGLVILYWESKHSNSGIVIAWLSAGCGRNRRSSGNRRRVTSSFPAPMLGISSLPGTAEEFRALLLMLMLSSNFSYHALTSRESLEFNSQTLPSVAVRKQQ